MDRLADHRKRQSGGRGPSKEGETELLPAPQSLNSGSDFWILLLCPGTSFRKTSLIDPAQPQHPPHLKGAPHLTVARGWVLGKLPLIGIYIFPHLTLAYMVQLGMLQVL